MQPPLMHVAVGFNRSLPVQDAAPHTVPSATGQHVPMWPGIAHELQAGHAPAPQQNPSVQWPLMQSAFEVQLTPLAARSVHEPARQLNPGAQSVPAAQVVAQAFALQR
jgi:hypothetical protein